jgi:hypothetical protein
MGSHRAISRRSDSVAAKECIALGAAERLLEAYPNREVNLGELAVGPCAADQGAPPRGAVVFPRPLRPTDFQRKEADGCGAYPHIGLQTVTWLPAWFESSPET